MGAFKGNDIRGVYGKELSDDLAYALGKAFVTFTKAKKVIVGRDVRLSSYALFKALSDGLTEMGADVLDLGLVDTPGLYFASCHFNLPAIMITASHNPANENGFYLCKEFARPINEANGLKKIEKLLTKKFVPAKIIGKVRETDISSMYRDHILSFVNLNSLKKLNIVCDAGNGMGAWSAEMVFSKLPSSINVNKMYFNLDGKFPNRSPNTAVASNLQSLCAEVVRTRAHFGFAFDGDADRVAFVNERGSVVEGSIIGAIIANYLLSKQRKKKESVVYSSTCSKSFSESIAASGGKALLERVGHTFVQQRMWRAKAIFGAENSGHYFYKDNWYADSGIITALLMCQIYSESDKTFSALCAPFMKYYRTEEVAFNVRDPKKAFTVVKYALKNKFECKLFDGISGSAKAKGNKEFWFSMRASETESLIRLNVEGMSEDVVENTKREIVKLIRTSLGIKR